MSYGLSTPHIVSYCLLQLDNRGNLCEVEAKVGCKNSDKLWQQRVSIDSDSVNDRLKLLECETSICLGLFYCTTLSYWRVPQNDALTYSTEDEIIKYVMQLVTLDHDWLVA